VKVHRTRKSIFGKWEKYQNKLQNRYKIEFCLPVLGEIFYFIKKSLTAREMKKPLEAK